MATDARRKFEAFKRRERKFHRACHHIRMLNRRIEETQSRYDNAYARQQRPFRYTYRLQIATLEGVRNMFYEYASRQAEKLEKIQEELIEAGLISPEYAQ